MWYTPLVTEIRARVIKRAEFAQRPIPAPSAADAPVDRPGGESPGESLTEPPDSECGTVAEIVGPVVRARLHAPGVCIGDVLTLGGARTDARIPAELVGFKAGLAVLLPLADARALGPASKVYLGTGAHSDGHSLGWRAVACGEHLLGRVLDGLGRPLDSGPALAGRGESWAIERAAPNPLSCPAITRPLATGVRAIDGLLTVGRGQRLAVLAGPGVGKSSLLGRIADAADVDVCVVCLVGERGRDMRAFVTRRLSARARRRTVAICAPSDAPSALRASAPFLATAIAEWFCARRGADVLLLVDSLTRLARAQREVGLAAGEVPVRRGYPPSVFARLPHLVERAGPRPRGSITALYSVLTDSDRADDPIAFEACATVDGHVALDGERAARGLWPAIDVLGSVSRVMDQVSPPEQRRAAARVRRLMALYREYEPLVAMGGYRAGSDPQVDAALAARPAIDEFLGHEKPVDLQTCRAQLLALAERFAG